MIGKVNEIMYDDFFVIDPTTSVRIPGITSTGFTKELYNPSGIEVSGSIVVSITELGNGDYRLSYTPNAKGLWKVNVFHATYFSAGKTNNHQIYNVDIDNVYTDLGIVDDKVDALITSTGHISDVVDEIEIDTDMLQTIDDKADALITSTGHISITIDSVLSQVNTIPTNTMLDTEDGSSFTDIPDMAKQTTLLSAYTSTGNALTVGFNAGAKENTVLAIQTSTGHISETVDEILASSTGATINPQDIRDAMKLSPSSGTSAIDSIDAKLDEIFVSSTGLLTLQDVRDAMKLAPSVGSPAVASIDAKINLIPTNPMLNSEDGSSFTDIPDMAKETTILSAHTSTGNALTTGFNAGAKQNTLLEVQTSTGHISETVDAILAGGSVDPQDIRDAMLLAPSGGVPAIGSIDSKLNILQASTGYISDSVDILKSNTTTIQNNQAITEDKIDELITSTGHISQVINEIEIDADLIQNIHDDLVVVDGKVNGLITSTGNIYNAISEIPTNPMLDTETGSSFTAIPNMALNSTVAKSTEIVALDNVIDAGFITGAKESTITSGFSAGAKDATVAKEVTLNIVDDKIDALIIATEHIHTVVDEIDEILGGIYLGDRTVTISIKDADYGNSLGDVSVQLWGTDLTNLVTYGFTDSNGEMTRTVNDGVYKVKVRKNGYQFNDPFDITVTADMSVEYTGTTYIIGPADDIDLCRLYGYIINGAYYPIEGVSICAVPYDSPTIIETSTSTTVISPETVNALTTSTGEFAIDLIRNVKFTVNIPEIGFRETIIVPNETGPITLWSLTDLFISGDPEKNDPNW